MGVAGQTTNKQHYGIWSGMLNPAMLAQIAAVRIKIRTHQEP
jgi:hypothetical protein